MDRRLPLALLAAVTAISFGAIFFRLAAPTHPLVSAGTRMAISSLLLSPFLVRGVRAGTFGRAQLGPAALAGLCYGLHFGSWVASLGLTTVAASVTLVTATPLLLAVHGWVTGRDAPSRGLGAALALALVGVLTIGGTDLGASGAALLGDGLALVGCGAMAAYLLLVRRMGTALDVLAWSAVATGVAAVALLGSATALGITPWPPTPAAAGWLALAAVVPQLIGHTSLTWALRLGTPTTVAMATVAEPVGATLLGWWILSELPSAQVAVGCAITLVAVGLALRSQGPRE